MAKINALRLKNLRCFNDTGYIAIKPITILVGKNSAGKSTFARTFPLLRQGVEEDKRSPILWFGRFVDFGDFKTAVNRNANEKEIGFGFKFNIPASYSRNYIYSADYGRLNRIVNVGSDAECEVLINLKFDENSNSTFASSIEFNIFKNKCGIYFKDSKTISHIVVNDLVIQPSELTLKYEISQKNLIPQITYFREIPKKEGSQEYPAKITVNPSRESLLKLIGNLCHQNTNYGKRREIVNNLILDTDEKLLNLMQEIKVAPSSFLSKTRQMTVNSNEFVAIRNTLFAGSIDFLLEKMDYELDQYFRGVRYIEPLRATAQRYYRRQELSVDEIDSKGGNVAMYVDSLSATEKEKFNKWLKKFFSVELLANNIGGHVALSLKGVDSEKSTNLADLGVGFSQIIPIILQLWQPSNINTRKNKFGRHSRNACVVIEQPELHLHPAYQAVVADVMVAALDDSRAIENDINIIAETHSPHLINRLGELVALGRISADDIQIILFDEDENNESLIKISSFDSDGVLLNWPFGFFEPVV